jgi:hypothetical protein
VHVILTFKTETERRFKAVLQLGLEKQVTVVELARLNRRETEYDLSVDHGHACKVILLSMPNGRCAWRIADPQHSESGKGNYRASPTLALRDGAIPYILRHEPRHQ